MAEVSVVIPAYNRAETIGRALDSVLAQSVADFEIIVVDDGSTDGTAEIVGAVADPRIRLLRHDGNRGAAAARNSGIRAATGEWIALLDSDDAWLPEKLAVQLAKLRSAPANVGVACAAVHLHLLDHGVVRLRQPIVADDWFARLAVDCDLSPGATMLARRDVFDTVGLFDETLPRFEDWDWLLRYARTGGIAVARQPLAHVYNRRGRLGLQVEQSARRFAEKRRPLIRSLPAAARRAAEANLWFQVSGTYAFEGRLADAVRTAAMALRHRPLYGAWRLGRFLAERAAARLRQDAGRFPD